jgi:hypothetical protein
VREHGVERIVGEVAQHLADGQHGVAGRKRDVASARSRAAVPSIAARLSVRQGCIPGGGVVVNSFVN